LKKPKMKMKSEKADMSNEKMEKKPGKRKRMMKEKK